MRDFQLKIQLFPGWSDRSDENRDSPYTFMRDASIRPGALQFSFAFYRGGVVPNPSVQDLIELSEGVRARLEAPEAAELVEFCGGACAFGKFGTAVFRAPGLPRAQIWHLSNGQDFILATHFFDADPDPTEIAEAQEIVRNVAIKSVTE